MSEDLSINKSSGEGGTAALQAVKYLDSLKSLGLEVH